MRISTLIQLATLIAVLTLTGLGLATINYQLLSAAGGSRGLVYLPCPKPVNRDVARLPFIEDKGNLTAFSYPGGVRSDTPVSTTTAHVTVYNPVAAQCDSTPWITASGKRSRPGFHCAVSRPMERLLGIRFGDKIFVKGYPSRAKDGGWIVADRMSKRWRTLRVDLMVKSGARHISRKVVILIAKGSKQS